MKKAIALLLAVAAMSSMMMACSSTESTDSASSAATSSAASSTDSQPVTIKWFQFQIENATQVKNLAKKYTEEHPNVHIEVDVMGDGYFDVLKSRAASGDMPDIFMTKGYAYLDTYKDYISDLSSQPFVSQIVDAAKPCISLDGKIMGLPVQMGGWGIVYNKKIFKDNNLQVPKTFSELKKVCETLKSKNITPFIDQYKDAWVLGHLTGSGVGRVNNPTDFIKKLNDGSAKLKDTKEMQDDINFLDLTVQYGQTNPLSADLNAACTMMAQGKGAMMPEGDWVYSTISQINPSADLGMFGVPTTEDASQTRIASDVNGVLHVSSKSTPEKQAEAEKILNWIVTSDAGKDFVTKQCKFIPAYKGLSSDINSIGKDISTAVVSGKASIWGWLDSPDGYENDSGMVLQEYVNKQLNKDQVLQKLDDTWAKAIAKK